MKLSPAQVSQMYKLLENNPILNEQYIKIGGRLPYTATEATKNIQCALNVLGFSATVERHWNSQDYEISIVGYGPNGFPIGIAQGAFQTFMNIIAEQPIGLNYVAGVADLCKKDQIGPKSSFLSSTFQGFVIEPVISGSGELTYYIGHSDISVIGHLKDQIFPKQFEGMPSNRLFFTRGEEYCMVLSKDEVDRIYREVNGFKSMEGNGFGTSVEACRAHMLNSSARFDYSNSSSSSNSGSGVNRYGFYYNAPCAPNVMGHNIQRLRVFFESKGLAFEITCGKDRSGNNNYYVSSNSKQEMTALSQSLRTNYGIDSAYKPGQGKYVCPPGPYCKAHHIILTDQDIAMLQTGPQLR